VSLTAHNPDTYMSALRTMIAQGRKRVGLLVGAGAPAGMPNAAGKFPLIPAVAGLTEHVLGVLKPKYEKQLAAIAADMDRKDIEAVLSRIRALSGVLGASKVHDFDGSQYATLGNDICTEIGKVVDVRLPKESPYADLVGWITGTAHKYPVEIFTTNYDLLFEEALEAVNAPFFDGFSGGREPFFDPVSISQNDLPARWTRLWKLHGSVGWRTGDRGEVVRSGERKATHLVFPEHLKYDQTQKAPYAALFDRLRAFLATPDVLLISIGFSFADAHISARVTEGLAGNPSASTFAFQFRILDEEISAKEIASKCPNFSLYARDKAVVNGNPGPWALPSELPSRDWGPIRNTYWGHTDPKQPPHFLLGSVAHFAKFFAGARSPLAFDPVATSSTTSP